MDSLPGLPERPKRGIIKIMRRRNLARGDTLNEMCGLNSTHKNYERDRRFYDSYLPVLAMC
jgi:hypothetical protein